jgi:hypothetical protein
MNTTLHAAQWPPTPVIAAAAPGAHAAPEQAGPRARRAPAAAPAYARRRRPSTRATPVRFHPFSVR